MHYFYIIVKDNRNYLAKRFKAAYIRRERRKNQVNIIEKYVYCGIN